MTTTRSRLALRSGGSIRIRVVANPRDSARLSSLFDLTRSVKRLPPSAKDR